MLTGSTDRPRSASATDTALATVVLPRPPLPANRPAGSVERYERRLVDGCAHDLLPVNVCRLRQAARRALQPSLVSGLGGDQRFAASLAGNQTRCGIDRLFAHTRSCSREDPLPHSGVLQATAAPHS